MEEEMNQPRSEGRKGKSTARRVRTMAYLAVCILLVALAALFVIVPIAMRRMAQSIHGRVKADLRSMATALESYYVDQCSYPAARALRDQDGADTLTLQASRAWTLGSVEPGRPGLMGLTTPTAYLTSLFPDPYAPCRGMSYAFYEDRNGWILFSPGPDGDYDLVPARDYSSQIPQPSPPLLLLSFDPTNGYGSNGDIWRVKQ